MLKVKITANTTTNINASEIGFIISGPTSCTFVPYDDIRSMHVRRSMYGDFALVIQRSDNTNVEVGLWGPRHKEQEDQLHAVGDKCISIWRDYLLFQARKKENEEHRARQSTDS